MATTATTAANRAREVECGAAGKRLVLPARVERLRDRKDMRDSYARSGSTCAKSTPTPTEC